MGWLTKLDYILYVCTGVDDIIIYNNIRLHILLRYILLWNLSKLQKFESYFIIWNTYFFYIYVKVLRIQYKVSKSSTYS